ncbi:hypothetical protein D3C81_1740970 [compost metagenome]
MGLAKSQPWASRIPHWRSSRICSTVSTPSATTLASTDCAILAMCGNIARAARLSDDKNDLSSLMRSTVSDIRHGKPEYPEPKSSMATPTPALRRSRTVLRIEARSTGSRSVSSTMSPQSRRPASAHSFATIESSSKSSRQTLSETWKG